LLSLKVVELLSLRAAVLAVGFFILQTTTAVADCVPGPVAKPYKYAHVERGTIALLGEPIDEVSAFAWQGKEKRWRQVPIQIDEKNARGDYVLIDGLPYTKESDDRNFDVNDELIVDGRYFGDNVPRDAELPRANYRRQHLVHYCLDSAYVGTLLLVTGDIVRSTFSPEVQFDSGKRQVDSAVYQYEFNGANAALLGSVALKSGDQPVKVIEDSKFLMPLRLPWWLPNVTFRHSDFESSIESWQVGPLRTIVAVGVKYQAFLSLFKLHLFSELVFYRNQFQIPTVIEFVFDPSKFLQPGSGLAYSLQFPAGKEWKITSNLEALPAVAPDSLAKLRASNFHEFRAAGTRPEGSFQIRVRVDDKAKAMVPPPFLVEGKEFTSAAHQNHWPWLKELTSDLGIFLDFSGVSKGVYEFGLDLVLETEHKGEESEYGLLYSSWQEFPAP
jgi:hypothetical protein